MNTLRPPDGRALLTIVPLAFLCVFFLWPVVAILGRGLTNNGSLDLTPLGDILRDASMRPVVTFPNPQRALTPVPT
mgnify:CR=1 FL=1